MGWEQVVRFYVNVKILEAAGKTTEAPLNGQVKGIVETDNIKLYLDKIYGNDNAQYLKRHQSDFVFPLYR